MTTLELSAELFRQLSVIAEDETLMQKAVKAIRKLARQKEEANYISKAEVLDGVREAMDELKDYKEGRIKLQPFSELIEELKG